MIEQVTAIVRGRVQGVGYRFFAERWANQLGVTGYAKNLWNGDVEVVGQTDKATLETFITKLREGPRAAIVNDIEVTWEQATDFYPNFDIRF